MANAYPKMIAAALDAVVHARAAKVLDMTPEAVAEAMRRGDDDGREIAYFVENFADEVMPAEVINHEGDVWVRVAEFGTGPVRCTWVKVVADGPGVRAAEVVAHLPSDVATSRV